MDEKEVLIDNLGWEKGTSRKYAPETKQQIIRIREELEKEDILDTGINCDFWYDILRSSESVLSGTTLKEFNHRGHRSAER